jgi:hypothetical protein
VLCGSAHVPHTYIRHRMKAWTPRYTMSASSSGAVSKLHPRWPAGRLRGQIRGNDDDLWWRPTLVAVAKNGVPWRTAHMPSPALCTQAKFRVRKSLPQEVVVCRVGTYLPRCSTSCTSTRTTTDRGSERAQISLALGPFHLLILYLNATRCVARVRAGV